MEIDPGSGFCGGVIRAVSKAEDVLSESGGKKLYSLGSIVHNESELERLRSLGLVTVSAEDLETLPRGSRVLIRRTASRLPHIVLRTGWALMLWTAPVPWS